MTSGNRIKNYFAARKRRKLLAEYKSLRHAEDDLLDDDRKREFDAVIDELEHSDAPPAAAMAAARESMRKIDLGIRHPAIREILDLVLVVGAVAAGIRGLFLQPFRIPTGSMQPTLYGIHYRNKDGNWRDDKGIHEYASDSRFDKLPGSLQFALFGRRRARLIVEKEGSIDPRSLGAANGLLTDNTSFRIGGNFYTLPGEKEKVKKYAELTYADVFGRMAVDPDTGRALVDGSRLFRRGEKVADGFLTTGDHLFVERCSLYLKPPKRGDVMVFNTENLDIEADGRRIPLAELSGYYYIKRVVGLPGDTLKIEYGKLFIKPRGEKTFRRADELDPRFKKIFSGKGGYQGYTNEPHARYLRAGEEFTVPKRHYFMLGDNTAFSMDSRYFGAVPRRNLVGRAFFVFWPCSRRWGMADSKAPLDVPTERDGRNHESWRVMYRQ